MRDLDSMTALVGVVKVWPPTLMVPPPSNLIDASGDAAGGNGERCDIGISEGPGRHVGRAVTGADIVHALPSDVKAHVVSGSRSQSSHSSSCRSHSQYCTSTQHAAGATRRVRGDGMLDAPARNLGA